MAKRYNHLWESITSLDNIKNAHRKARRDKSFYEAVQKTDKNLDGRALKIQEMLTKHTYNPGPYNVSMLHDVEKDRVLFKLPYYPDRIIQWAILIQIEQIFLKKFTNFTCASIPGRGCHYASNMVYSEINNDVEGTKYCLKLDIKKFYPSINRKILKQLLRKTFKDKDLLIELDKIIDSVNNIELKEKIPAEELKIYTRPDKGIPIGSYLSQYLANYYLCYFDHWLKETLKIKHVVRYMDDIVIFSNNKEQLWDWFYQIKDYLKDNLDLEIKENYQVFPTNIRGVDFVGYRHFCGYKLLRKRIYKNTKKLGLALKEEFYKKKEFINKKLWYQLNSRMGWLYYCNSFHLYNKYFGVEYIGYMNIFYYLEIQGSKNRRKYFKSHGSYYIKQKKYFISQRSKNDKTYRSTRHSRKCA